jgi:hypothetical protein
MIGLLNEEEAAVRKNGKSEPIREAGGQGQLWLQLPVLVREEGNCRRRGMCR